MSRTSIVHLQEPSYAVCCNLVCLDTLWGWRKNCSSSFTLITIGRIETYQIATYSIRTLLKMDYWSPRRVELLNVVNKINHQILCILDYIYICIAKWYTVHTVSNSNIIFHLVMETEPTSELNHNDTMQNFQYSWMYHFKEFAVLTNLHLRSIFTLWIFLCKYDGE